MSFVFVASLHACEADVDAALGSAPTTSVEFQQSDDVFPSPERGFYSAIDLRHERDYSYVASRDHTLGLGLVRLDEFRDRAIPEDVLDDLALGMAAAREAGIKVILRFAYNEGPYPDPEPDASKAQVLAHIAQIEPLLVAEQDTLAVVQAGFIGAWGEWHSSTNALLDDPRDRRDILEALLLALPETRMVQLRRPTFKEEMYGGPLTSDAAFTGDFAARTGHHNDCWLASVNDLGTYPEGEEARWRQYISDDALFVPMGGETCNRNPPRTDCPTALAELALLRLTFLNEEFDQDVLAGWANEGCLDDIRRRLGYRFELRSAELPIEVRPGGDFRLRAEIANVGVAPLFNPRPLWLVLSSDSGPELPRHYSRLDWIDPRRWTPGASHFVEAEVELPADLEETVWRVGFWLPDASERLADVPAYALRFATRGVFDPESGLNVLGTLRVDSAAAGRRDEDRAALVVRRP